MWVKFTLENLTGSENCTLRTRIIWKAHLWREGVKEREGISKAMEAITKEISRTMLQTVMEFSLTGRAISMRGNGKTICLTVLARSLIQMKLVTSENFWITKSMEEEPSFKEETFTEVPSNMICLMAMFSTKEKMGNRTKVIGKTIWSMGMECINGQMVVSMKDTIWMVHETEKVLWFTQMEMSTTENGWTD